MSVESLAKVWTRESPVQTYDNAFLSANGYETVSKELELCERIKKSSLPQGPRAVVDADNTSIIYDESMCSSLVDDF